MEQGSTPWVLNAFTMPERASIHASSIQPAAQQCSICSKRAKTAKSGKNGRAAFKYQQVCLFCGMAKQTGTNPITGTIDGICFYELQGKHYARLKSSLSGKRVKTDPAFAGTMQSANLLATASRIVKPVYADLPAAIKKQLSYQQLTGKAMRLLKAGSSEEECGKTLRAFVDGISLE